MAKEITRKGKTLAEAQDKGVGCRDLLGEREARAHELRTAGKTFSEIAQELSVSPGRARQIVENAARKIDHYNNRASDPLYGLSVRAANCLLNRGLNTRDKIIAAIASGEIAEKCHIRNFSRKTYVEVCTWAGVEPKLRWRKHWKFDPYTGEPIRPPNNKSSQPGQ